jgi:GNAT superfamily N-acetyltransferase
MVFAIERLSDILAEVRELWKEHFAETEAYRHSLGYNPNEEAFLGYERQGMFRLYTAREGKRLVGQVGFLVYKSRHTQTMTAAEDFFYVRPEVRGKGVATGLLRFALQDLRDDGIPQATVTDKLDDDARRVFEKLGFKMVARQYSIIFKET